jgi:hypothetical protein
VKRIYYAHCVAIYDTPQEERDIATLEGLGFNVLNPNDPQFEKQCQRIRKEWQNRILGIFHNEMAQYKEVGEAIMHMVFKPLVSAAKVEGVAFRALPDGRIPAGVAQELEWARQCGLPILELPAFAYDRVMSLSSTRTYLHEIGER